MYKKMSRTQLETAGRQQENLTVSVYMDEKHDPNKTLVYIHDLNPVDFENLVTDNRNIGKFDPVTVSFDIGNTTFFCSTSYKYFRHKSRVKFINKMGRIMKAAHQEAQK